MGLQPDVHTAYGEVCRILNSFAHFGVRLGLESTQMLLSHLDNPHHTVPIVHVAGTNGKGSVCAYLSTILTKAGYRVGRYTSPYLVDWTEQICVKDQPIAALSLLKVIQKIQVVIQTHHLDATQFEVLTAAAWLYFAEQQVDLAIIEVGMGGRLDTTNVCDRPLVSVITSIGRDHWQQLGNTLSAIAGEKAGILKPQRPAIIGPLPPEAQTTIAQKAHSLNCPTQWVSPSIPLDQHRLQYCAPTHRLLPSPLSPSTRLVEPSNLDPLPTPFIYSLALKGEHQHINSALAIATINALKKQGWHVTPDHICQGLAQTQWPGRLQWITWNGQDVLIDGAHNTAAAKVLRQYVDTLPQPIHWIIGMLASKDHAGVFKTLLKRGDSLSLVPVPDRDSAQPTALAQLAEICCSSLRACKTYTNVLPALNQVACPPSNTPHMASSSSAILEKPRKSGTLVLCGSLYLIGYLLKQKKTLNA